MVLQVPKQRRLHCKQNINFFHRALRGQERQEVFQSSCPQCKLLAFNNTLAFHELGACRHGQSTREGSEHVLGAGHYPALLVLSVSVVVCCSEKVLGGKVYKPISLLALCILRQCCCQSFWSSIFRDLVLLYTLCVY